MASAIIRRAKVENERRRTRRRQRRRAAGGAKAKRSAEKATKQALREHVELQRQRLLGADAVIICIQRSLDSLSAQPDEIRIGDALQVASTIINNAVEALETVAS